MKMKYIGLIWGIFFLTGCGVKQSSEQAKWQKINSVESLWTYDAERIRDMLNALDLQQADLESVRQFLVRKDTIGGLQQLLAHYKNNKRDWVVTTMETPPYEHIENIARAIASDSMIFEGKFEKMPVSESGGWKWDHTGPDHDDEFGYTLNGHRYMLTFLTATQQTGNKQYIQAFDRLMKDWVIHHKLPEKGDSVYLVLDPDISLDYRDIGEVEWRTLQAGQRLGATWPQTFYAFQDDEEFSPATRLLMLCSLQEQAGFLRKYHKSGHNWTTMEMNGLALAGLAFPEFKESEDWANYALEVMTNEINRQVYPDGLQTELSTKTQWVALHRFESVADNFKKADREISQAYIQRIEEMYAYLAYAMRPDGHQPLNSDSDREDLRPRVLHAAKKYNKPDWEWIATNGKSGEKPPKGPSLTFPWAGIHVMRSGWDKNAHWSFFDNGPYGTGHQHRDKLHLSISAYGKDLLVDGGRFTHKDYFSFDPTIWRGYFRSSLSHNVILVDGNGQSEGPVRTNSPLEEGKDFIHHPKYDYSYGTFTDGFEKTEGTAVHSRSVLYLHDEFWVVLDQFETDRQRDLEVLWHFSPDSKLKLQGNGVVTENSDGPNLSIIPLGDDVDWNPTIVKGQEEPFIQGWYSAEYGVKTPIPTLIYQTGISGTKCFAWVLVPAKEEVQKIKTTFKENKGVVEITVSKPSQNPVKIYLPLEKDVSKVKVDF
ncbi:alginate lyase family protein [Flexithrix dorotheae]|uniref:alginate lyase family protein n=1 Tax=Flexithrix dorotheae TaxID=70993 RepID=UPI000364CC68|nr:alginate lyase family protein [Flexithrix dorotheae]